MAERLIANALDGVVLATTTVDSVVPVRLRDRGVPFVYFNRTSATIEADSATVDPGPGLTETAEAIAGLGHHRVAAIFGPLNTSTGAEREASLREALGRRRDHDRRTVRTYGGLSTSRPATSAPRSCWPGIPVRRSSSAAMMWSRWAR